MMKKIINLFSLALSFSYIMPTFPAVPMTSINGQGTKQGSNAGFSSCPTSNTSGIPGVSGKQRLRWTSDLHSRFVDAIAQLGGPDS